MKHRALTDEGKDSLYVQYLSDVEGITHISMIRGSTPSDRVLCSMVSYVDLTPKDSDKPFSENERCCPICNALSLLLLFSDGVKQAYTASCDYSVTHVYIDGRNYCSIHRPDECCTPVELTGGDEPMCDVCHGLVRAWAHYAEELDEEEDDDEDCKDPTS